MPNKLLGSGPEEGKKIIPPGPPAYRSFLWHETLGPNGWVFVGHEEEDKALSEGWVDTPAKLPWMRMISNNLFYWAQDWVEPKAPPPPPSEKGQAGKPRKDRK